MCIRKELFLERYELGVINAVSISIRSLSFHLLANDRYSPLNYIVTIDYTLINSSLNT